MSKIRIEQVADLEDTLRKLRNQIKELEERVTNLEKDKKADNGDKK